MDNKEIKEEDILNYDLTKEEKETITVDYRNSNYKLIKIPLKELSSEVTLKQNFGLGKGGIFWDGSYFVTKYLINNVFNDNIKNVLELGAGTSLPSLASLIKGYNVYTTDIPKFIPFINDIMNLNKHLFHKNSNYNVMQLSWEKKEDICNLQEKCNNKPFDLIIGSELIYLDDLFDDLINVIRVFSNEKTYIILSYKIRLPSMIEDFLGKLIKYFEIEYINYELENELYPKPEKLKLIRIKKIK
jgi:predicted nicotinamide N-methyase